MADLMAWTQQAALFVAVVWGALEVVGRGQRWLPAASGALVLVVLIWRGIQIEFLPLTSPLESFLCSALMLFALASAQYATLARPGRLLLVALALGCTAASLAFDGGLTYPSALLYTAWYAVHVPLSFAAYAFFVAAAANAADGLTGVTSAALARQRQEHNTRWGLWLFSAAMVFGSIWGIVSWGVYFLWDAKILWSLATWLFFATLIHLRYWPLQSSRAYGSLGLVGAAMVVFTFVGTSFMEGSVHSFR